MINGPTAHLSWKELACKDGTEYPLQWRDNRAIALAGLFEHIREQCGNFPITVHSAYRTPSYNKRVGGVARSQHLYGRALDLSHSRLSNRAFYKILRIIAEEGLTMLRGLGKYDTFCHIDIRPTESLASWNNSSDQRISA